MGEHYCFLLFWKKDMKLFHGGGVEIEGMIKGGEMN